MKDLINIKIFLKKNIPWFEAYICNYSCKIILKKPYLLFRKVSALEKQKYLHLNEKRALVCKVGRQTSFQLFPERCSDVIVLLCKAKT